LTAATITSAGAKGLGKQDGIAAVAPALVIPKIVESRIHQGCFGLHPFEDV